MEPNIDISGSDRGAVCGLLNNLLSDEYVLYTKSRNYHWNVVGPQFHDLHKFFEGQYEELNVIVDDVAERVRSLGGRPESTLAGFLQHATLREMAVGELGAMEMVRNLLHDHESVIRSLRRDSEVCLEKHHDSGTNDFLVGLMEQHEKMAWMLRSCLEGKA